MMQLNYKAVFHEKGFIPGKDITEEELEQLRAQFVEMQNLFADGINPALKKLNDIWARYEDIRNKGDVLAIWLTQNTMGINSETEYNDWLAMWYEIFAHGVDLSFQNTRLESNIFRDGDQPIYGVRFKDHPEWTMDITLEPM